MSENPPMASGRWITRRADRAGGDRRALAALALLAAAVWPASAATCDKPVYLTLDTGHMEVAPLMAQVLNRHHVKVTFFAGKSLGDESRPVLLQAPTITETVIPIHGTGRMIPMRRLEFPTNDSGRFPRHLYAPDWLSEIVCGLDGSRTVRERASGLAPGRVRFGAQKVERRDVLHKTLRMLYSLPVFAWIAWREAQRKTPLTARQWAIVTLLGMLGYADGLDAPQVAALKRYHDHVRAVHHREQCPLSDPGCEHGCGEPPHSSERPAG